MRKYIVFLKTEYLRDTQIYHGNDYEENIHERDEEWADFSPNHFIGIYESSYPQEAIQIASVDSNFQQQMLEAILVESLIKSKEIQIVQGQTSIYDYLK